MFHPYLLFSPYIEALPSAPLNQLLEQKAQAFSQLLGVTVVDSIHHLPQSGQVLSFDIDGLALLPLGKKAPGKVRVDFASGAVDHRRKFGGGAGQMIAKAVGIKRSRPLTVLDATAGLGRDAFVIASLGCFVLLQERQAVVAALLSDGLERAKQSADTELAKIAERMTLCSTDSTCIMPKADVIYLDPMFPERTKSASVKKEMSLFHDIVGGDEDADNLLKIACEKATYRVAVKRPRKAPFLAGQAPSFQLEGKTSRYDVYVNQKIPDTLDAD